MTKAVAVLNKLSIHHEGVCKTCFVAENRTAWQSHVNENLPYRNKRQSAEGNMR
jgi:hypothetical protein